MPLRGDKACRLISQFKCAKGPRNAVKESDGQLNESALYTEVVADDAHHLGHDSAA